MLVGAAKEVSAGAAGHERSRIVTAAQQPWIGQAALLGLITPEATVGPSLVPAFLAEQQRGR
jgi:hypothetical protein